MQVDEQVASLEFDEIAVEYSSISDYSLKPRINIERPVSEFAGGVRVSQTKRLAQSGMNVRAYPVLRRAVEEGVQYGWRRAHKHTDTPDVNTVEQSIVDGVLGEICEYFDFGGDVVEQ